MNLTLTKKKIENYKVAKAAADIIVKDEEEHAGRLKIQQEDLGQAQLIVQSVAHSIQQKVHNQIAGVVTRCLEAVFDDPYKFEIIFEKKRGRTEARLIFLREGQEVDPLTASGGGAVDVAAFALRLSCLVLSRPQQRLFMALDEPFKFVSEGYRDRVRMMMEGLSADFGVQFLMITHMDELKAGSIVELG